MQTLEQIQSFEGKYPKQIWSLFFTEMWERFCFYGNRGMLVVFMTNILFFSDQEANLKYGAIQAFVYAFTFIGGLFADKILGFQKSLLWASGLYHCLIQWAQPMPSNLAIYSRQYTIDYHM